MGVCDDKFALSESKTLGTQPGSINAAYFFQNTGINRLQMFGELSVDNAAPINSGDIVDIKVISPILRKNIRSTLMQIESTFSWTKSSKVFCLQRKLCYKKGDFILVLIFLLVVWYIWWTLMIRNLTSIKRSTSSRLNKTKKIGQLQKNNFQVIFFSHWSIISSMEMGKQLNKKICVCDSNRRRTLSQARRRGK